MIKKNNLTSNQKRVLEFISIYIKTHSESPTITEIKEKLKFSSSRSVTQYLESLMKKGLVDKERYKSRGISIIGKSKKEKDTIILPVFASAGCGSPSIIAQRTFDDFVEVSSSIVKGKKKENLYVIKAIGNSMNMAGINDGDYVLVERMPDQAFSMGDSVVAIIDDNAVIKKYVQSNDLIVLQPASSESSHRPIILDSKATYKIFGKVLRTIRMPKVGDLRYVPVI